MKQIKFFIGLSKKIFRREIFYRLIRLIKYKILRLRFIKNSFVKRKEFFLIYTMGKIGSSSIYETLRSKLAYNNIYHILFLTEKNIKWRQKLKGNPSASIVEQYVKTKLKKIELKN